jgi:hypothetical protein
VREFQALVGRAVRPAKAAEFSLVCDAFLYGRSFCFREACVKGLHVGERNPVAGLPGQEILEGGNDLGSTPDFGFAISATLLLPRRRGRWKTATAT